MLKFDEYPDSCPPGNAIKFEGTFYRLCKGNPFCKEDFLTHFEAGLNFPSSKLCEAMALSFYESYAQAESLKNQYRKRFKDYSIRPVKIIEKYGVGILEEKKGHLNLWENRDVDIFSDLIREGGDKDE